MLEIQDCLAEVMAIPGALDVIMVDHTSGMPLATGGGAGELDAQRSASALSETLRATLDGLALCSPGETVRISDIIVTTDQGHHLLKPVETAFDGPFLIYLRLDPERSNPALALHRLRRISGRLFAGEGRITTATARGAQEPPDPPPEPSPYSPPATVRGTVPLPRREAGTTAGPRPGSPSGEPSGWPPVNGDPSDVDLLIRLRNALKELS